MATPAAAALFAAALQPIASTSQSSSSATNHHPLPANPNSTGRGRRGGAGLITSSSVRGRAASGSRGGGRGGDEDVGMDQDGATRRRGRTGRASNPMGERPSGRNDWTGPRASTSNAHNAPATIRNPPNSRQSSSRTNAPPLGPPSASAIETLKLFLLSRYSPVDKMLNLENMASDAVLQSAGLKAPGEKDAPSNVAGAMWKLAGSLFPEVVSLSLANNSLTSILPLSPYLLTTYLPNIVNISLASNSLGRIRDVDCLSASHAQRKNENNKPRGWPGLREMVLTGNPLVESGLRELAYRSEIARKFPALTQLDQQPIDPAALAALPVDTGSSSRSSSKVQRSSRPVRQPVVFPLPTTVGFTESEGTRDFVAGFLMKFFAAFDTDRASLLPAYAPNCTFSFLVDTLPPSRAKAKKIGLRDDKVFPHQRQLDWKSYLTSEGSRNLDRVKSSAKRVATLQVSPQSVIASIIKLPNTAHPLTDPSKFVFDTWTMPGLLPPTAPGAEGETVIYAIVHGEYTEYPSKGIRSFDRTFILAPAAPGSLAQVAGWPCVILSDMFIVRIYSDPNAWAVPVPKAPDANPVASTSAAAGPPPIIAAGPPSTGVERAEGLSDQQQNLILALQHHTKLTYSFAHLCMVHNNWDPAAAVENVGALVSSGGLPAEAFMA